jgi:hypothetical protein
MSWSSILLLILLFCWLAPAVLLLPMLLREAVRNNGVTSSHPDVLLKASPVTNGAVVSDTGR